MYRRLLLLIVQDVLSESATRGNTRQHAATRCNTLQHAATRCNTLQHAAARCNTLQPALVSVGRVAMIEKGIVCCVMLHCVAVWCSVFYSALQRVSVCVFQRAIFFVLQCVLQCIAECFSVCVSVCFSVGHSWRRSDLNI